MHRSSHDATTAEPVSDLTLSEAAALYAVSARTLAQHIRYGQLPAYKTSGATGREWRVASPDLAAAGNPPRPRTSVEEAAEQPLVMQLRRELTAARRAAAAERRKAEDAYRCLGHALLECGRLREALAAATGQQGTATRVDMTSGEARELIDAFRGGSTDQHVLEDG